MAAVYAVLVIPALLLISNKVSIDQKNQWNWGIIILAIEMVHLGLSFKIIGPTELGAVLLFGRPLYQVQSGLVFAPFIICQIIKETCLVIKKQFPEEPELVDKTGDDTKPVRPGFVKPIRVTTASGKMLNEFKDKIKNYEKDPLNDMLTLEPSVVVRFQIQRDNFIPFLINIGSVRNAVSQMRDTVDAVLNIEFPKRTPALIILEKEEINKMLKKEIEDLVGEKDPNVSLNSEKERERWGIDIINVQLVDVGLGKTINAKIEGVPDSKLSAEATVRKSQAEKDAMVLKGQGEKEFETDKGAGVANARKAYLKAEAEGLQKIANVAKTEEGKLAIITKATEQGLKGSQYSIIPDGAGSLIAGIREILKKTGSREASSDEKSGDPKSPPQTQEILKQIKKKEGKK